LLGSPCNQFGDEEPGTNEEDSAVLQKDRWRYIQAVFESNPFLKEAKNVQD